MQLCRGFLYSVVASFSGQCLLLRQRLHHFFHEEWRALSPFQNELFQAPQCGMVSEQEGEQLLRLFLAQWCQMELGVVGLLPPLVPILGTVVSQQEDTSRCYALAEGIQTPLGLTIQPMQVFKDEDQRLIETLAQKQLLYGLERAPAANLWVHLLERGGQVFHPQQGKEVRQGVFEATVQPKDFANHSLAPTALIILGLNVKIVLEQFNHRQIRRGFPI